MRLPNSQEKNLSWVFALNHISYKEKIELDFVHDFFFLPLDYIFNIHCLSKKKNHTLEYLLDRL